MWKLPHSKEVVRRSMGAVSPPQRHAHGPQIEKHSLRTTRDASLERDKAVACIPIEPVVIHVRDNTAASHVIRDPQGNLERFGNESLSEPPP